MPDPHLDDLVDLAVGLARSAGDLLLEGRAREREAVGTKSSATDVVTEMDHASESLIVEGLLAVRPDDAIQAEEGGDRDGSSGVRWVIDPLDGTTNYLYGFRRWSVSIGAEVDGRPALGVVADPELGEVFWAAEGRGAWCNGRPIAPTATADLAKALVATGFSYLPERRAAQAAALARVAPAVRDLRRQGVASLDLCWVACGRVDAYYEGPLQPWDVAAGLVIAAEAGACLAGPPGRPPGPDWVFAAAPGVATALLALLAEAGEPAA
jgi:myo-inositol-1(or 4)-monophosphatase